MTTKEDAFGYLGCEGLDTSHLLRALVASLEEIVATESAETLEQARKKARKLLADMRPIVDKMSSSPDQLSEAVRRHPLLALSLAGLAGFVLASLQRR